MEPLNRYIIKMFSFVYSKFVYPKSHNVYMSIDLLRMLCDIFYACFNTLIVEVKSLQGLCYMVIC